MYLSGYLAGAIKFRFPDNHEELLNPGDPMTKMADFFSRGAIPKRDDNTNYGRSQILGGELFDACPVDVILNDGRWQPAQLDAIKNNPAVLAAVQSCRYYSPAAAPAPPPQLPTTNAPNAGGGQESLTRPGAGAPTGTPGVVYLPGGGVATPTVITWPGGGGGSFAEPPAPPVEAPQQAGMIGGEALPIVAGLLLLGFFLSGKKKGRVN
jgi:hypothetical protein